MTDTLTPERIAELRKLRDDVVGISADLWAPDKDAIKARKFVQAAFKNMPALLDAAADNQRLRALLAECLHVFDYSDPYQELSSRIDAALLIDTSPLTAADVTWAEAEIERHKSETGE